MKKSNPRKYGVRYCQFEECKGKKVPAEWHDYLAGNACDKHKEHLKSSDDGYMSEGDYQSWGRLK